MRRRSHITRAALAGIVTLAFGAAVAHADDTMPDRMRLFRTVPEYGTHPAWNGLRLGSATETEVTALLGTPDRTLPTDGESVLVYETAGPAGDVTVALGVREGILHRVQLPRDPAVSSLAAITERYGEPGVRFTRPANPGGDMPLLNRYAAYPDRGVLYCETAMPGRLLQILVSPAELQETVRQASPPTP